MRGSVGKGKRLASIGISILAFVALSAISALISGKSGIGTGSRAETTPNGQ